MGREIRRVPKGWEHPRDESGQYIPMFDETYEESATKWIESCIAWHNRDLAKLEDLDEYVGKNPKETFDKHPFYWEWTGNPPKNDRCRPKFDAPADHFQMYETVSEGTPMSPVFETKGELAQWLVDQGHSEDAASRFVEAEWAPSMIMCATQDGERKIYSGVDTHEPNECGEGDVDGKATD